MRYSLGIAVSIVVLLCGPQRALAQAEYLAVDAPDVVRTTPIVEMAVNELGSDAVRIYEFVRNEFEYQHYYGLMKGPEGTLFSRAGNDYDLAALLVSLLRAAGIPARFARGKVAIPATDAASWLGLAEEDAGVIGQPALFFLGSAEPSSWRDSPTNRAGIDLENGVVHLLRVWVEAQVPLARYRGAGKASPEDALAWVPLDPSFKLNDWPEDPQLPFDSELAFDYSGENGFYARIRSKLPVEILEDQVREYLADTHDGTQSPRSVSDVALRGSIRREEPGVLANALPYGFTYDEAPHLTEWPPRRAASLVALHDTGALNPSPSAGTGGAKDYRYVHSVHVCVAGTATCENLDESDPAKLIHVEEWSAEWEGKRVNLMFPAQSPGSLPNEGYSGWDCQTSGALPTVPTLFVEASPVEASASSVDLCDEIELVMVNQEPLGKGLLQARALGAGGIYVLGFESYSASARRLEEAAEKLVAAEAAYPLANDAATGLPFVDVDGDGMKDPGVAEEEFLGRHFAAQEALVGGLLDLAGVWYFRESRDSERRIDALHFMHPVYYPGVAMVSAGRKMSRLLGVPFSTQASNLLIDVSQGGGLRQPSTGGSPAETFDPALTLLSHQFSALEHAVWEELAGVEAISTVKGFQVSNEALGNDTLIIPTEISADAATASCGEFGCADLDLRAYCEIKNSFGTSGEWKAPLWDHYCGAVHSYITEELRIMDFADLSYRDWQGYVFANKFNDAGSHVLGMVINPIGANGGHGLEDFDANDLFEVFDPEGHFIGEYFRDELSLLYNTPIDQQNSRVDPVSLVRGNFHTTHTDLRIRGRGGMDLVLERSYNSRFDYPGPLGYGWTHSYDQHLRIEPGDPAPDDERVVWIGATGSETPWTDLPGGAVGELIAPSWVHHRLERNGDGSFTLTTKDGMTYQFLAPVAEKAALASITNRNGQTVSCHYQNGALRTVTDTPGAGGTPGPDRNLTFSYDANGALSAVEDWTGRCWRYVVDGNGDLVQYWDPEQVAKQNSGGAACKDVPLPSASPFAGRPWGFEYHPDHNLRRYIQPEDRDEDGEGDWSMTFDYYANDTVYKHTDSNGRATRLSYNFFRKRTDITHPDGTTETYFYDGSGDIIRTTDGSGAVRELAYDTSRNPILERDALGFETRSFYDDRGNLTRRIDRLGHEARWSYNAANDLIAHTGRRGGRRSWEYDASGNLTREFVEIDGSIEQVSEHRHDAFGNRTETTTYAAPGRGGAATTRFFYTEDGVGLTRVVDPLGYETRFRLDALARPERVERERTVATDQGSFVETVAATTEYDALDRPIRTTDPGGLTREIDYDANGLVVERRTLAPGQPPRTDETRVYDAMDRLVSVTNTLLETTSFFYDERDRISAIQTPLGHVTRREYDGAGRLVREIDPAGASWRSEYDAEGRLTRIIDPLGRVQRNDYDPEGRVVRAFRPADPADLEAAPTDFLVEEVHAFDADGHPLLVRDAEDHESLRAYDELGRIRAVTAALGTADEATTRFSYDLLGRLVSRMDAEGREAQVQYDALGRVNRTTDPLGRARFVGYDELGNPVETVDGAGISVRYEYDSRGLLLRRTGVSAEGRPLDERFTYDAYGRRIYSKAEGSRARTFVYDDLDRAIAMTNDVASSASYGTARLVYDADGRVTQAVYPAGVNAFPAGIVANYQYDERGLISHITDPLAGSWHFEYDAAGRLVRRTDPFGGQRQLTYDPQGFVEGVAIDLPDGSSESVSYPDYDRLGNPRKIITSEGMTAVQYDALSRVTQVAYPGGEGVESFQYDRVGNRIQHVTRSGQTRLYQVDPADQLEAILDDTSAVLESFTYDGAGRRRTRTAGSETTTYEYDAPGRLLVAGGGGAGIALTYYAEGDRLWRVDGLSLTSFFGGWGETRSDLTGFERRRLVHGPGDDPVLAKVTEDIQTTRVLQLYRDGHANVRRIALAEDGSPVSAEPPRRYEAFGIRRDAFASLVERGFAGQQTEGSSGLIHMGARHYDPATGTFLQTDPLGLDATHIYAYANQNPYRFWDPTGLDPDAISQPQSGGTIDRPQPSAIQDQIIGFVRAEGLSGIGSGIRAHFAATEAWAEDVGLQGSAGGLEFLAGPPTTRVYQGIRGGKAVYTGITNNLARRGAQHAGRFGIEAVTPQAVSRGQARAIEQALINRNPGFENKINSISPLRPYYDKAVSWGEAWLKSHGF